jgi:hypothetical protein
MATPWESPIIRISTGFLNTVSETIIGGQATLGSRSRYGGQLGKSVFVSADQIAALTNTTIGTLYGGAYQYVRRRATDDASPALGPGKIAFWDTTLTNWQNFFQVTTDENLSSSANAIMIAGIFINNIAPGSYGFIQWVGEVFVRFRSVLTAAGAIGSPVYAAGAGDTGLDQGTADVLTTDSTAAANQRFLGNAVVAPTASGLKQVQLNLGAGVRVF